jgi:DNA-directed RNA polymerase specialized sigma24 family protein
MSTTIDGGEDFARLAEPFRRELIAYGYRMLGSVDDAEEVVQDVYLDAWRAYSGSKGAHRCARGCIASPPGRS